MTLSRTIGRLLLTCLLFAGLFAPGAAEAQEISIWLPKFVCGYQLGDIRLLSDGTPLNNPTGYERFKPGNYATTINVTNTTIENRTVYAIAIVTVPLPVPWTGQAVPTAISIPVVTGQVLQTGIPLLLAPGTTGSMEVNCNDLAGAINANGIAGATGGLFEGRVFLATTLGDDSLDVVSVVTYANKDQFSEHVISALPNEPGFGGPHEPPDPGAGERFGVSGAGGLGLGGSIDVERFDSIAVDISGLGGAALATALEGFELEAIQARDK